MKKAFISVLFILALVISVMPVNAFAVDENDVTSVSPRNGVFNDRYEIGIGGVVYVVYKDAYYVLMRGTTHAYVEIAQRALLNAKSRQNLNFEGWWPVTTYFGEKTYTATIAFQQWWNDNLDTFYGSAIDVDGIIGDDTWRRFVSVCM